MKGSRSAGNQLKHDIVGFLYALSHNIAITSLDITGHQMGNKGTLSKVLFNYREVQLPFLKLYTIILLLFRLCGMKIKQVY